MVQQFHHLFSADSDMGGLGINFEYFSSEERNFKICRNDNFLGTLDSQMV